MENKKIDELSAVTNLSDYLENRVVIVLYILFDFKVPTHRYLRFILFSHY